MGGAIGTVGLGLVGVCALAVVAMFMRAMPRATFVAWVLVLFFVPVWIGISAGIFWAAITVVTLLAVLACGGSVSLTVADGFMAAFVLLALGQYALGASSLSGTVIALTEWTLPYLWGRLVLARVDGAFVISCLAGATVAASVMAIIEFVSGVNVFLLLPAQGPAFEVWGTLQTRGGLIRTEGAFGHSIALAAALAMGSAFVLAARWRTWAKLVGLLFVTAAVVVTLSRIGLVTLVITVALTVVVLPGLTRGTRLAVVAAGCAGALLAAPFLDAVFSDAGQEAEGSAQYRSGLLQLLPLVRLVGAAQDFEGVTRGGQYLGYFANSVDNALLVVALRLGWLPTLLLVLVFVSSFATAVNPRRTNPAAIAIAAQAPSLFAVAFITQYGMFFWFVVGLSLSMGMARIQRAAPEFETNQSTVSTLVGSGYRRHAPDGGFAT